ncbi:MAG TPA: hypothetical protein VK470_06925 [Bacteroidota bacterium]|nr:hypothetical protein [Bacteroidota bacterium]
MTETVGQSLIDRCVIVWETEFAIYENASSPLAIHQIWEELVHDSLRLSLIAKDVVDVMAEDRFPLILSDRRDHLELILSEINNVTGAGSDSGFILTSDIGK